MILVIVNCLTKIVHYKLVKTKIDVDSLAKVIINVIIKHHSLPNSIINNQGSLFSSKFWFLLYNFLDIKWRLSNTFHPQTDSQTKRQNSMIDAYLHIFVS